MYYNRDLKDVISVDRLVSSDIVILPIKNCSCSRTDLRFILSLSFWCLQTKLKCCKLHKNLYNYMSTSFVCPILLTALCYTAQQCSTDALQNRFWGPRVESTKFRAVFRTGLYVKINKTLFSSNGNRLIRSINVLHVDACLFQRVLLPLSHRNQIWISGWRGKVPPFYRLAIIVIIIYLKVYSLSLSSNIN